MTEADFLHDYDPTRYERPSLAVDLVLLGVRDRQPMALLQRREEHPFQGCRSLPGGFVGIAESLDSAAARVLQDKALLASAHLEQLYTFGTVDRDPRTRVVTVAWLALLNEQDFAAALAGNPSLAPVPIDWAWENGSDTGTGLAFDHAAILAMALRRLRGKLDYSDVGFALLPPLFTLRQLQDVHEAIGGFPLNKPAFRRRMRDRGWLEATGLREEGTSYRPAELFRYRPIAAAPHSLHTDIG